MDTASKITLVIAVLLLVILIIITILNMLRKGREKTPYPECPDYWNKIVGLGPGGSVCVNTRKCNGKKGDCRPMQTYFSLNNNTKSYYFNYIMRTLPKYLAI